MQRLTKSGPTSIIQQPHLPHLPLLPVVLFFLLLVTGALLVSPLNTNEIDPLPDLLNQLVEGFLVLGVVRGCLLTSLER